VFEETTAGFNRTLTNTKNHTGQNRDALHTNTEKIRGRQTFISEERIQRELWHIRANNELLRLICVIH
jgi:hypothetical protein